MNVISTAANQYANRPDDERFPSLDAMVAAAIDDKNHSAERTYNLRELKAIPDDHGIMLASPKGQATLSHWSFGQLARTVSAPAGYLRTLTPQLAADCINHGITRAENGTDVNLLLRTANGSPEPIIRACTSETYGRVWDADLYTAISKTLARDGWTLPPTWDKKPAGAYRSDRDSFLILTEANSSITDPSFKNDEEGKMYRALLVRNSEVGAASITIEQILYRYVCGNHNLWGAVIDQRYRRRHVGARILRDTIREINEIAYRWQRRDPATDQAIIENLITANIATTKDGVIDELRALGFTEAQAKDAYATCERNEHVSPRSFWGIAQGTTRLSQDTTHQNERYDLDQLAALVLKRGAAKVAA